MPIQYAQGDVFQVGYDEGYDFILVFGHIGFNEMHQTWDAFSARFRDEFGTVDNPFNCYRNPVMFSSGRWIQFVPAEENHGMEKVQLRQVVDAALLWAAQKGLRSVITNGIMGTDHGLVTLHNRASDDERVIYINKLVGRHERNFKSIKLISLNDAFVRTPASSMHGLSAATGKS